MLRDVIAGHAGMRRVAGRCDALANESGDLPCKDDEFISTRRDLHALRLLAAGALATCRTLAVGALIYRSTAVRGKTAPSRAICGR